MKSKKKIVVTKRVIIPKRLKGRVEEQWLKNLDTLTKPGGEYEKVVKLYYEHPEQIARQEAGKRLFGKKRQ